MKKITTANRRLIWSVIELLPASFLLEVDVSNYGGTGQKGEVHVVDYSVLLLLLLTFLSTRRY